MFNISLIIPFIFYSNGIFFTERDEIEQHWDFSKILSWSKEQDGDGLKINLANAWASQGTPFK